MSRPTIDYPWVKHEQKSKEKTSLASHPQNLIQKKRQGLIIGTTKKSLLCSKTRLGQTFEFFGEWLLRSFPNWSRPLSMSDDMWSLVRAEGRVYKDGQRTGASQSGLREKLDSERFLRKVQCPENCFSLPC